MELGRKSKSKDMKEMKDMKNMKPKETGFSGSCTTSPSNVYKVFEIN